MKIRYASDLHLEFVRTALAPDNFYIYLNGIVQPQEDDANTVLILAGDIDIGKHIHVTVEYFSERFKSVLIIAGNHEYYGSNILKTEKKIRSDIEHLSNVHMLNNESIEIDNVNFIGSTLWTNMNGEDPLTINIAGTAMNDYKQIRHGTKHEPWKYKLSPHDTVRFFRKSKEFIFNNINSQLKNVVITHHAPSFKSVSVKYRNDLLSGAYATELFEDIYDNGPDIWIHGHLHTTSDYAINNSRVLCNPFGYADLETNDEFDSNANIEV